MGKVFISYARDNRPEIDQLKQHLELLSQEIWVDSVLRGGQTWWDEILRQIKECDVFIPVISQASLRSTACSRELDWAEGLGKTVLPVSLEPPGMALPRRILVRQIVDYSDSGMRDQAALRLAGALASIGPPRPLPKPLPEPPAVPLSYLAELIDQVSQAEPLDHDQQHQILIRLDQALRAADPEERRGGRDTLERFSTRSELYADVYRRIEQLRGLGNSGTAGRSGTDQPGWQAESSASAGYRYLDDDARTDQSSSRSQQQAPPHAGEAPRTAASTPTTQHPPPPRRSFFGNNNSLAVWALILSLIGLPCLIGSVPGIVLGVMALKQIDQTGENGRGLAISGIAIGSLALLGFLIAVIVGAMHPSASS
jgi:TIR domain/Domain of unknown function (DUF4190)